MWHISMAFVAVTTCWPCSVIAAKADVEIGVLTCTLGEPGEALPSTASLTGQTRNAFCTFKPKSGADETYAGKIQGVSISQNHRGALIWVVRHASRTAVEPGLLQQSYTSDRNTPTDQEPPMMGEANADIALHTMADKSQGSASTTGKATLNGYVILSLELKLKSSSA